MTTALLSIAAAVAGFFVGRRSLKSKPPRVIPQGGGGPGEEQK